MKQKAVEGRYMSLSAMMVPITTMVFEIGSHITRNSREIYTKGA